MFAETSIFLDKPSFLCVNIHILFADDCNAERQFSFHTENAFLAPWIRLWIFSVFAREFISGFSDFHYAAFYYTSENPWIREYNPWRIYGSGVTTVQHRNPRYLPVSSRCEHLRWQQGSATRFNPNLHSIRPRYVRHSLFVNSTWSYTLIRICSLLSNHNSSDIAFYAVVLFRSLIYSSWWSLVVLYYVFCSVQYKMCITISDRKKTTKNLSVCSQGIIIYRNNNHNVLLCT